MRNRDLLRILGSERESRRPRDDPSPFGVPGGGLGEDQHRNKQFTCARPTAPRRRRKTPPADPSETLPKESRRIGKHSRYAPHIRARGQGLRRGANRELLGSFGPSWVSRLRGGVVLPGCFHASGFPLAIELAGRPSHDIHQMTAKNRARCPRIAAEQGGRPRRRPTFRARSRA